MSRFRLQRLRLFRPLLTLVMVAGSLTPAAARSFSTADSKADEGGATGGQAWEIVTVPNDWKSAGKIGTPDGFLWYAAQFRVPADWMGKSHLVRVEALDDARATYVNGRLVGNTGQMPPRFRSGLGEDSAFTLAPGNLRADAPNVVLIRIHQRDPRPNFSAAPPVIACPDLQQAIRLQGRWYRHQGDLETADDAFNSLRQHSDFTNNEMLFRGTEAYDDLNLFLRKRDSDSPPLTPEAALAAFQTTPGISVDLFAADPLIAQPLFMTWDDRGRMWVLEYRQYPEPAGLKTVSRDAYLRSVYDKIPPPPPDRTPGRDRISILEDTNGDGIADKHTVFLDNLNIATSVAVTAHGIYVTNPPYLLRYQDQDGDDVPDGDPEVLLEGFGMEDLHSVVNSLSLGHDGRLYAAQGSTVSGRVRRPGSAEFPRTSMGQLIWRFDPQTGDYDIYAEGGGNTFGVEISRDGDLFSGHNGGDTRGFHYVRGGYYQKGFTKHGPLSNPWAFGFFSAMKHPRAERFTHNFVIYEDEVLREQLGRTLLGIEPLQGRVVRSRISPDSGTYSTEDIDYPLKTSDPWFRPVDIKTGPDGCLYIADFYEQRIDHSSHYAGRIDRTNGRIYRLRPTGGTVPPAANLTRYSDQKLVEWLRQEDGHPRERVTRAVHRLANRLNTQQLSRLSHSSVQEGIRTHARVVLSSPSAAAEDQLRCLQHADGSIRRLAVRVLVDRHAGRPDVQTALILQGTSEHDVRVRKELAAAVRHLETSAAVPLFEKLLRHKDSADTHQPLLLWWAAESLLSRPEAGREVIDILCKEAGEENPVVNNVLLEHSFRRLLLPGRQDEMQLAAIILEQSPSQNVRDQLAGSLQSTFRDRPLPEFPAELNRALLQSSAVPLSLRIRHGDQQAAATALERWKEINASERPRIKVEDRQLLAALAYHQDPSALPILRHQLCVRKPETREEISMFVNALSHYVSSEAGEILLDAAIQNPPATAASLAVLVTRQPWAEQLLQAIRKKQVPVTLLSSADYAVLQRYNDAKFRRLLGEIVPDSAAVSDSTAAEENRRIRTVLAEASGSPRIGKPLFQKSCGQCHQLFGEGGDIGPDLTTWQRQDIRRLLTSILTPDDEIREGYETWTAITVDGRILSGFLADQSDDFLTLRTAEGRNVFLQRSDIDELIRERRSVMPKGLLTPLSDQELRDLFAYLRASQPVNY